MLTSALMLLAPAEVGEVCAFLASDKSSYVTGSLIEVTGKLPLCIVLLLWGMDSALCTEECLRSQV